MVTNFISDKEHKSIRLFASIIYNSFYLRKYNMSLKQIHEIIEKTRPDGLINFYDFRILAGKIAKVNRWICHALLLHFQYIRSSSRINWLIKLFSGSRQDFWTLTAAGWLRTWTQYVLFSCLSAKWSIQRYSPGFSTSTSLYWSKFECSQWRRRNVSAAWTCFE